ncbi:hypothetical protein L1987_51927 [Smallanthus sonchifolius]|uniref:Uncharacterized protein n=1 Tax=Smallanthus sonchifolius TaxID=185202 RepID=A0ACB9ERN6_9ASTR|nr:hypothetical protein L1987_51927 [Smallanthus sonchifolius]
MVGVFKCIGFYLFIRAILLFGIMKKKDIVSWNALIGGYIQAQNIEKAYKHFNTMQHKDVYSWTTIITGKSVQGLLLYQGLQAMANMKIQSTGCRRTKYFKSMRSFYKLEPSLEHYACMVDLLGQAGLLDKAYDFIKSIPFEPRSGVWGSLLGTIKTHFLLDFAEIAAQHIS